MALGFAILWGTSSFKLLIEGENSCYVFFNAHLFILLGLLYFISSLLHSTPSSELSSFLFHFLYLISFPIHFILPDDANRLPIILGLQFTMNFFILLYLFFSHYLHFILHFRVV